MLRPQPAWPLALTLTTAAAALSCSGGSASHDAEVDAAQLPPTDVSDPDPKLNPQLPPSASNQGPIPAHHAGAPDFDGDGTSDLAVYQPRNGRWLIRQSSAPAAAELLHEWGWSETVPVPGDYDGDHVTDIAVFDQRTGTWWVRQSMDGTRLDGGPIAWGSMGTVPVPGDYDGDGVTDLAVYHPEKARWRIRSSADGELLGGGAIELGSVRSRPVPGDYDGDGITDLAAYEPSAASWTIRQSSDGQPLEGQPALQFGWSETVPVPGDYDGDSRTDLAVYHPATGDWYVRESSTGGLLESGAITFGPAHAMPVPGDYDGDGRTDLAVYGYDSGQWHIRRSSDGALLDGQGIAWGGDEAVPVPAPLKGILWNAQLPLPETTHEDGIENLLEDDEQAAVPIELSYDRDWIIQAWMTGLNGGYNQRYLTFDKGSHPDVFFRPGNILALRVYNRKIWLLKDPVVGGGHALYPSFKHYDGTVDSEGNPGYVCDESMTSGDLCNSDHIGATLEGSYASGSHSMRLEYLCSKSRSGKADEGVFRFYWDGQLVGDWNLWIEQLPPVMQKLYVGRLSGGTIRYYQGFYQSVIH